MLSVADANALVGRHLGDTPRAAHTRVVGYVMRKLAEHFSDDGTLWEVVVAAMVSYRRAKVSTCHPGS